MRQRRNITQIWDETASKAGSRTELNIREQGELEALRDPLYLSQEMNRELSGIRDEQQEMRDELNKKLNTTNILLGIIALLLILIFLVKVI